MSHKEGVTSRLIPLDAGVHARFLTELPAIVAWREQRLLPGRRRWSIEALGYGLLTLAGLQFFAWSPMLVFLHLVVTQWIGLLAEVLVLRRLAQQGITRLLSAAQVNTFVNTVSVVLERANRAGHRAVEPRIPENILPDVIARNDSTKNAHPRALAGTLVFLGVLASGFLLGALIFAKGSLREELLSQPLALVLLGGASLVQLVTQFRSRLSPPMPGARWNVEFSPGLRIFGLMLIAMISPAVLQEAEEVRDVAMGIYAAIAFWGATNLVCDGMLRRETARLRAHLVEQRQGSILGV